jgi:hypothetical protein
MFIIPITNDASFEGINCHVPEARLRVFSLIDNVDDVSAENRPMAVSAFLPAETHNESL